MASPQKENGYTPISNEILEKLAQTQISGNDRRILDVVIRKTYGFQKKQDKISLSQFVLATLLIKSVVCRGLKRLQNMNIIIKIDNNNCTIYRFNKDFDTWKSLAKLLMSEKALANMQMSVSNSANASLANLRHTKETTTKETLTKEKASDQKDRDASSLKKTVSELEAEGKIGFGEKCVLGIPTIPPRMSMKKEYRNKGQEFGRLVLWLGNCFAEAYEARVGEKYLGGSFSVDPISKQVSKFKNDLALGRTQLKEMLDQYFKSEKAEELTISLNTAFSDDTYLQYKQGKLLGKKKKKLVKYEE